LSYLGVKPGLPPYERAGGFWEQRGEVMLCTYRGRNNWMDHNSYSSANTVMVIKLGTEMGSTFGMHGGNEKKQKTLVRKSETRRPVWMYRHGWENIKIDLIETGC
jgi:hypothetical protein